MLGFHRAVPRVEYFQDRGEPGHVTFNSVHLPRVELVEIGIVLPLLHTTEALFLPDAVEASFNRSLTGHTFSARDLHLHVSVAVLVVFELPLRTERSSRPGCN